jgi:hypothetical protein
MRFVLQLTFISCMALAVATSACTRETARPGKESAPDTTRIDFGSVKWQSIGNCWNYAVLGFIEAQEFRTGKIRSFSNYSESYITYRHFQDQLTSKSTLTALETGGSFDLALELVRAYGLLGEADFIPEEADSPKSSRQKAALDDLNAKLKSGEIKTPLTKDQAIAALNAAFKVDLAVVAPKIITSDKITVRGLDGADVPLAAFHTRGNPNRWVDTYWNEFAHPRKPGSLNENDSILYSPTWEGIKESDRKTLRGAIRALNDGHPVVMSWLVEFGAAKQGVFDKTNLKPDYTSDSGLHMTAIVDYVATGIDPETGVEFMTPEGDVPQSAKDMAVAHGELRHVIVKNSWGNGFDRHDRSFWVRNGTSGYHRVEFDYLMARYWLGQGDASRTVHLGMIGVAMPERYKR